MVHLTTAAKLSAVILNKTNSVVIIPGRWFTQKSSLDHAGCSLVVGETSGGGGNKTRSSWQEAPTPDHFWSATKESLHMPNACEAFSACGLQLSGNMLGAGFYAFHETWYLSRFCRIVS